MSHIYKLLRLCTKIRSNRLKMLGVWIMHILHKRYIGIFLDPVLACNLRCKMCYFSDADKRKNYQGILDIEDIRLMARAMFHRALKLQIGCGAEPTLYKYLEEIVYLGKLYGVPYISLTTNGNLLTKAKLEALIKAGLDELTLSAHGLTKDTYENFMVHADFAIFSSLLKDIEDLQHIYPKFKFRLNYTMNQDNVDELAMLWQKIYHVDILQLRPIQQIGNSTYKNFSVDYIYKQYDKVILPIIEECKKRGVTYIIPEKKNLKILEDVDNTENSLEQATYCTISPRGCWKDDFNYKTESFESYSKRVHLGRKLFKMVFSKPHKCKVDVTKKMNYKVN